MVGDVKLGVLTILNLWIFFMKDTLRFTSFLRVTSTHDSTHSRYTSAINRLISLLHLYIAKEI